MSEKIKTKINFSPSDWNMFSVTTSNYNTMAISIFKKCIGRVYDPSRKCWLFPNKSYKYLFDLLSECDEFELESTIHSSLLSKIQIVINKEDENEIYVQTPFDEKLIDLFNNLNGFFVPETKLWCFRTENRVAFDTMMLENEYEIKFEKDKPKSKYIKYFSLFYFPIYFLLL